MPHAPDSALPAEPGAHWRAMLARTDVFRLLFDNMDEGYCVIEFLDGPHGPLSDYIHVAANRAYAENAGIENVVGQRLREMVPDEADAWIARYGPVLATGQPIRFEQELVATGRHLELSAFRLGTFEDRLVAVLFKDVTVRRAAERELARATEALESRFAEALAERALLAAIVEGSDAMVQVTDMDMRWLAINHAAADEFERIFGVRPKVGERAVDLLADRPEHAEAVRKVWDRALQGEAFVERGEFGDPGPERRCYEMRFNILRNADGEQIGAYQFVYDVTEQVATERRLADAENELRQAQKMEAVGQLTGGLAHDFNNLLGGMSGALELVEQRLKQGRIEDVGRYVAAAKSAADRAASLTHRLLAFSRRQTLTPQVLDPAALIRGMVDLASHSLGPGTSIAIDLPPDPWTVRVDPSQLENALLNLVINARDAMPDGGEIRIAVANWTVSGEEAQRRAMEPGDYLRIEVIDRGCGIPSDTIDRVFDPFFTTKPLGEGTGLGLSMVYGFVKQSRGYVFIESIEGAGTTVALALPKAGDAPTPHPVTAPISPSADEARTIGGTILVVDDEVLIRMTVAEELADAGFTCIEAGTGADALRLLDEHPEVLLLLTDVGLPGGLNGRQVADAARVTRPSLPVLFITGYADQAALADDRMTPGMAVLTKPFRMGDLLDKVRELLAGSQGAGAHPGDPAASKKPSG